MASRKTSGTARPTCSAGACGLRLMAMLGAIRASATPMAPQMLRLRRSPPLRGCAVSVVPSAVVLTALAPLSWLSVTQLVELHELGALVAAEPVPLVPPGGHERGVLLLAERLGGDPGGGDRVARLAEVRRQPPCAGRRPLLIGQRRGVDLDRRGQPRPALEAVERGGDDDRRREVRVGGAVGGLHLEVRRAGAAGPHAAREPQRGLAVVGAPGGVGAGPV